ncbi:C13 family peptidase [soil metagenome]
MTRAIGVLGLAAIGLATAAPAQQAPYQVPQHNGGSPLFTNSPVENSMRADAGAQLEQSRPVRWSLEEHRKLDRALAGLAAQRKGVVDAYVVSIALDSDPVFGREAREAGKVLARRYAAEGRTIVLAGTDGSGPSSYPQGSPDTLAAALTRISELMDPDEDVLILYSTSHGAPVGVVYADGDEGFGMISPYRLSSMLEDLNIRNRLLIVSACFSGVFTTLLSSDTTAILTAASSERTSFGCVSDNDWTFFGDAMINHALRKPQPLAAAAAEASHLIGAWEAKGHLIPSDPQIRIGSGVSKWLGPLEAHTPKTETAQVGRPALLSLDVATENNH